MASSDPQVRRAVARVAALSRVEQQGGVAVARAARAGFEAKYQGDAMRVHMARLSLLRANKASKRRRRNLGKEAKANGE